MGPSRQGGYTYVEVRKAPAKSKTAAALGGDKPTDPMAQGFAELYTSKGGDVAAIFEVCR